MSKLITCDWNVVAPAFSGEMLGVDRKSGKIYAGFVQGLYSQPPSIPQPVLVSFDILSAKVTILSKLSYYVFAATVFDEKSQSIFMAGRQSILPGSPAVVERYSQKTGHSSLVWSSNDCTLSPVGASDEHGRRLFLLMSCSPSPQKFDIVGEFNLGTSKMLLHNLTLPNVDLPCAITFDDSSKQLLMTANMNTTVRINNVDVVCECIFVDSIHFKLNRISPCRCCE